MNFASTKSVLNVFALILTGIIIKINAAVNLNVGLILKSLSFSNITLPADLIDGALFSSFALTADLKRSEGKVNISITVADILQRNNSESNSVCNPSGALKAFSNLANQNVDAVVGPSCFEEMEVIAQAAKSYGSAPPIIAPAAGFLTQNGSTIWRSLQPKPERIWPIFVHFTQAQKWRTLCVIADNGDRGFRKLSSLFTTKIREDAANFDSAEEFSFDSTKDYPSDINRIILLLPYRCRTMIIIADMPLFLTFMKLADDNGFINSRYAFMHFDGHRFSMPDTLTNMAANAFESRMDAARILQNVAFFTLYPELQSDVWRNLASSIYNKATALSVDKYGDTLEELQNNVLVLAYSQAVDLLVQATASPPDLNKLKSATVNTKAAGKLTLDDAGNKVPDGAIMHIKPPEHADSDLELLVVTAYDGNSGQFSDVHAFEWIGGSAPSDTPPCGFFDPKCSRTIALAIIFPLLALLILFLLYKIYVYRRHHVSKVHVAADSPAPSHHHFFFEKFIHKPHQDGSSTHRFHIGGTHGPTHHSADNTLVGPNRKLDDNDSRLLRWDQITLQPDLHRRSVGHWGDLYEKTSRTAVMGKDPKRSAASMQRLSTTNYNFGEQARLGVYKNYPVCLYYVKNHGPELDDSERLEILLTAGLFHANVAQFFGLAFDESMAALVYECPVRGTLYGLLQNMSLRLDLPLKYCFIQDVLSGLVYLHDSKVRVHGCLSTHTCFIDEFLRVRLTDYGLHSFHRMDDPLVSPDVTPIRYLWIAPEVLRQKTNQAKTQEGDMYSLGMVIYHILARKLPYTGTTSDILSLITALETGTAVSRPEIDQAFDNVDQGLVKAMQECWSDEPRQRPKSSALLQNLAVLKKQSSVMASEDVALRLRNYSDQLERLVNERTHGYYREKDKADEMLFHVLPPSIATKIKAGGSFQAQIYPDASVLMSSVVDFPNIVIKYKPEEVVSFLNEVYTLFDGCIKEVGITNIESIGDTRIAASGLPDPNPERHAVDMATFSLNLIAKATTLTNLPVNEELKFRIGISSGPVSSGLINLALPKFCIFGETINSSAKMQALSAPNRIHIASTTKSALDRFKMFDVEMRRDRKISIAPGFKGAAETYWLNGFKVVSHSESEEIDALSEANSQAPVITVDPFANV
ncbi:receptor-type guanylate cyclase gcy-28-like [Paramacrobiotus metropolitanus]|uniref:receptor-type guanylate cyclase gcy-28-like n=1 Tax=Paramacrobiotus metropolitanus TaxID=2943436 RepID=UPI002445B00E|nr:receptor-type guanylate cyclase gcy-28-like [Paramacrobiotus metropolitanus]